MQLALVSDVHGNVEALEVVLAAIDARNPDAAIICAGDIVGYGPDPEACLELLRDRHAVIVMGNHEQMVLGHRDFSQCIYAGITAALWTRRHLAPSVRTNLEQLPAWADAGPGVVVCHGDLEDANTYVADAASAQRALEQLRSRRPGARGLICGHTHHAAFYTESSGFVAIREERTVALPADEPYVVNPGAVGQSRDGRVHASYAVLDLERSTASYFSLPYDSETTIAKLQRAGLVAQVVAERPRGAARHVENTRIRIARRRAQSPENSVTAVPLVPTDRSPIAAPAPTRRERALRSAQRGLQILGTNRIPVPGKGPAGATMLAYGAITKATDAPWVDPRFATPLEVFAAQVEFLARHRRVLSLTQMLELLERGEPLPPDAVVLTFDGGHRGVPDCAVPVLRRWDLPATVYLPTAFVSHAKPLPVDELYGLFNWRTRNVVHLAELGPHPISLYDPQVVRATYLDVEQLLIASSCADRDRVLSEIRAQLRPERTGPRVTATWEELRHAREFHPRIDLGVQTRHLVDLTSCSPDIAAREIIDSIADVHDALAVEALDLAYPFNRHSYTASAVARGAGLRSATIIDPAAHVLAGTDRFTIPRIDAPPSVSLLRLATGPVSFSVARTSLHRDRGDGHRRLHT